MKLLDLFVENVRGFQRVHFSLPPNGQARWIVFAGLNGAGKTTLLRAIALASLGPDLTRRFQDGLGDWLRNGAARAFVLAEFRAEEPDRFVGAGKPPSQLRTLLRWENSEDPMSPRAEGTELRGVRFDWKETLRGPWAVESRGWFLAGYGPFRRLSGHAAEAQRLMSGPRRVARCATLFREDASLLEALEWLRDLHVRALENDERAARLKAFVFDLLNDGLLPDSGLRVSHYNADGLWVRRGEEAPLRLQNLSDGYRSVAAMVLDLFRALVEEFGVEIVATQEHYPRVVADAPGIVLIDEVDAHLHVSWQRRLAPWLLEHFPSLQFIVSTHSPFVCQAAHPGGLVLLPPPGSKRKPRIASDALHQRVVNGGVDDALLSELFGLEHTWSDEAERKRVRLGELDALALEGTLTKPQRLERDALLRELPHTLEDAVDRAAAAVLPRKAKG